MNKMSLALAGVALMVGLNVNANTKSIEDNQFAYSAYSDHKAVRNGNIIEVSWTTTLETNSAGYIVYAKKGDSKWTKAGELITTKDKGEGAEYSTQIDDDGYDSISIMNLETDGGFDKFGPLEITDK